MGLVKTIRRYILNFGGFSKETAIEWIDNGKNVPKDIKNIYEKYLSICPICEKYSKLADNRLSLRYEFADKEDADRCSDFLLKYYFQVLKRNGVTRFIPLQDWDNNEGIEAVIACLKRGGSLAVMPAEDIWKDDICFLNFECGEYYIDGQQVSEEKLNRFLGEINDTYIITESIGSAATAQNGEFTNVTVIIENDSGANPHVLLSYLKKDKMFGCCKRRVVPDCTERKDKICGAAAELISESGVSQSGIEIKNWQGILEKAKRIALSLRELNYLGVDFVLTSEGYKVLEIQSQPAIPENGFRVEAFRSYITKIYNFRRSRESLKRRIFMAAKSAYSDIAERKGYLGFMMKNWQRDLADDWLHTKLPVSKKLWAHKRGFLSYRIAQYGLNEKNYAGILSDRDYRKLRPINNGFLVWVYDKVITRYILSEKKNYMPQYYFHLIVRSDGQVILPLPDLPSRSVVGIKDIVALLKEKKVLAFKPSEGSHGEGFYKLEYRDACFCINDDEVSEEQLELFILSRKAAYNVTEYVANHHLLSDFYSNTTFTVRIMVINENVTAPWIGNAYLRIATQKTGATDNIAHGGVCARIDIDTGRIYEPEIIVDHKIKPCPCHPDSGKPIEGFVPNWEEIKEGVLDISKYLCQLEYLGFDVVVTEDGFRILEINTHQDLHRYPHYSEQVQAYFMEKVQKLKL